MQRRNLLLSTGSVITLGVVTAGCADDSADDSAAGTDHLEQAYADLDEAGDLLAETDQEDFNSDRIIRRTDSAREELTEARGNVPDEEIENLESVADTVEEFTLGFEKLVDLDNRLDTLEALVAAERYDDATDEIEAISNQVNEVRNHVQNAEEAFGQIDSSAYDGFDELDQADLKGSIAELVENLDAFDILLEAFDPMIDGLSNFQKAIQEVEAESWSAAEVRFTDAAVEFEEGASIAQNGLDEAPSEFRSEFVEMGCLLESLQEGSEHFADAMNHLSNHQRNAAEESIDDAERALERSDRC